jgi:hypothetical protein
LLSLVRHFFLPLVTQFVIFGDTAGMAMFIIAFATYYMVTMLPVSAYVTILSLVPQRLYNLY